MTTRTEGFIALSIDVRRLQHRRWRRAGPRRRAAFGGGRGAIARCLQGPHQVRVHGLGEALDVRLLQQAGMAHPARPQRRSGAPRAGPSPAAGRHSVRGRAGRRPCRRRGWRGTTRTGPAGASRRAGARGARVRTAAGKLISVALSCGSGVSPPWLRRRCTCARRWRGASAHRLRSARRARPCPAAAAAHAARPAASACRRPGANSRFRRSRRSFWMRSLISGSAESAASRMPTKAVCSPASCNWRAISTAITPPAHRPAMKYGPCGWTRRSVRRWAAAQSRTVVCAYSPRALISGWMPYTGCPGSSFSARLR